MMAVLCLLMKVLTPANKDDSVVDCVLLPVSPDDDGQSLFRKNSSVMRSNGVIQIHIRAFDRDHRGIDRQRRRHYLHRYLNERQFFLKSFRFENQC